MKKEDGKNRRGRKRKRTVFVVLSELIDFPCSPRLKQLNLCVISFVNLRH